MCSRHSLSLLSIFHIFILGILYHYFLSSMCSRHSLSLLSMFHVFQAFFVITFYLPYIPGIVCLFLWLSGLFAPPGHIETLFTVQALYLEPRTRLYEIRRYRYRSSLRVLTAGPFRPTVVGKVCFVTSPESGLSPLDIVCMP